MGITSLAGMLIAAVIALIALAAGDHNSIFIPGLLEGLWLTVRITAVGAVIAVFMAIVAALARLYGSKPVRWLAVGYVEFFRGTSALVQLFWLFLRVADFGIFMEPFTVAVVTLGLNVGAYGAEVVRGAIQGITAASGKQRPLST